MVFLLGGRCPKRTRRRSQPEADRLSGGDCPVCLVGSLWVFIVIDPAKHLLVGQGRRLGEGDLGDTGWEIVAAETAGQHGKGCADGAAAHSADDLKLTLGMRQQVELVGAVQVADPKCILEVPNQPLCGVSGGGVGLQLVDLLRPEEALAQPQSADAASPSRRS